MYGKVFASMYDGSIYGKWKAIITLQQMITLADKDGVLDMTPEALSARTSIPLDIIREGIVELESPDKASRTPDEEGRRIIRLDEDRPWGWKITNYTKYREIRTAEDRREYHRRYYHEKRKLNNSSTDSTATQPSQPIVEVEAEVNVKTINTDTLKKEKTYPQEFEQAWESYPKRSGSNPKKRAYSAWNARLKEGVELQTILDGITRYSKFIKETGKSSTEFVMQMATFLGPDEHFKNDWALPVQNDSPRTDQGWMDLGKRLGLTANRGESMNDYIRRIQMHKPWRPE